MLVIAIVAGAAGYSYLTAPKVDAAAITARLEDASELTTQKFLYSGLVEYEAGQIPILTQTKFLLTYDAVVRAGVDMSQVQVADGAQAVTVTVPHATIQAVEIDPDSIKFYDQSLTIIRTGDKTAAAEALRLAKGDADLKARNSDLLSHADEQSQLLLTGFIANEVNGKTIEVEFS
ncbi:MAG: DUF4230 domain-containing protein [Corynebacterium sp.]|nr:DUF4230 domain-containing protein [Corynebacterium sp.]